MSKASEAIIIRNARENNLKSIDLDIQKNKLVLVTGVSGSGKSSLIFDIIHKEGQRLYLESFSSYARQYLGKLQRPDLEHITGLTPTIAVNQKTRVRNPRSTVGTLSEIYDYLRLLFARFGNYYPDFVKSVEGELPVIDRSMFSFNSPKGACKECKGLGVEDFIDPELLISDSSKSLSEGALVITAPNGYIIYSQVTMDVLNQVCNAHGFDVDIPWKELSVSQKDIVLNGSDLITIPYGKHPLESRLKWTGITAKPREEGVYKGILPVMKEILKRDRNKNILRFARTVPCSACEGKRLCEPALQVGYKNRDISYYSALQVDEVHSFFESQLQSDKNSDVEIAIFNAILSRTQVLKTLGLNYLTLGRESTSLSGGEAQRIRLANQAITGLRGITYIFDEPSVGLHHSDNKKLLSVLEELRNNGNTVFVAEHDEDTILKADTIIDIGPGSGINGGEIIFCGSLEEFLSAENYLPASSTQAFITRREEIKIPTVRLGSEAGEIFLTGATKHNLQGIDVLFKAGAFNVVTGVSGAGKSTLINHILVPELKNLIAGNNQPADEHPLLSGSLNFNNIIDIDQSPIGKTPRSNPATYTKLSDHLRNLFALLPESKKRSWNKGRFSFNVKGGRCEKCEGAGKILIGMHFLGNVEITCGACNGKRFNNSTLEVNYKGKNISDVLEMSVVEALSFFDDQPKIYKIVSTMYDLGLGYLSLGQSSTTLSGGEAQRIKLATELSKSTTGRTLYVLNEPTTGLHSADVKMLLSCINKLVVAGNTIISIEHNPDFILSADWVVDLGPESGTKGGELVCMGTPEEVASNNTSRTGMVLRKRLSETKEKKSGNTERAAGAGNGSKPQDGPIRFSGVCTNNLKNITVEIPYNKITVITGVSGSGKSSLAFDTLFSEGQTRFLEGFSSYIRSRIPKQEKALYNDCEGLMPTVAISQKVLSDNPRSTVGTITEVYDYYRLLFARAGVPHCINCGQAMDNASCKSCESTVEAPLTASMFSFNHEKGACTHCKGLGSITVCDPGKLITDNSRQISDGAMNGTKTGRFYGDPDGQYIAILKEVAQSENINLMQEYGKLSRAAQDLIMYGRGDKEYNVRWQYKRKNRTGEHTMKTTWPGFVSYVNQEYERKHSDQRGSSMLNVMKDESCSCCMGHRLKAESAAVRFAGKTIAELSALSIDESIQFFTDLESELPLTDECMQLTAMLRKEIIRRCGFIKDLGLGYLSINRNVSSVSGGEIQRLRLAGQLGSGLCGVAYILDEPTIGLHSRDTAKLVSVLRKLKALGNTVVVVEHDRDIIRAADHIIDMGPGAGEYGGRIIAEGSPEDIAKDPDSTTGKHLIIKKLQNHTIGVSSSDMIRVRGAFANNLKDIDVDIPNACIVAVTGVSGSGKTSLVFDCIAKTFAKKEAAACMKLSGIEHFRDVIMIDRKSIGKSYLSNPATYTGIFDAIRALFASTEKAKKKKYSKSSFSFNVKGGRCEACTGLGKVKFSMDFLPDIWNECEDCKGERYNPGILECTYNGMSISETLSLSIEDALIHFKDHRSIAETLLVLKETGLSYVKLGQAVSTLSGGELQRLKLANELINTKKGKKLYLFDEPSTGLHFADIEKLMSIFKRLTGDGHSVIIIEHNTDIIAKADYLIDLGPEGGNNGGQLVVSGTPREVAEKSTGFTAKALSGYFT